MGRRVASPGRGDSALQGRAVGPLWHSRKTFSSNGRSCCCRGSDSQRTPELFPSFLPFFRNHLAAAPPPPVPGAAVHLATHSPEPARASSQGRGGHCSGLPNSTNSLSRPEKPTPAPCRRNGNGHVTHRTVLARHLRTGLECRLCHQLCATSGESLPPLGLSFPVAPWCRH